MKLKGIAELQVTKGKKHWAGKEKARLLEMQRNKRQEERAVLSGQDQSQSPGQTEEDTEVSSGKDLAESTAESGDFSRYLNTYLRPPSIILPKVNSTRKPYYRLLGSIRGSKKQSQGDFVLLALSRNFIFHYGCVFCWSSAV